jgi:hypothetical protein
MEIVPAILALTNCRLPTAFQPRSLAVAGITRSIGLFRRIFHPFIGLFPSGTGFVTLSLTFLQCLSKEATLSQRQTFRAGQHAPPRLAILSVHAGFPLKLQPSLVSLSLSWLATLALRQKELAPSLKDQPCDVDQAFCLASDANTDTER